MVVRGAITVIGERHRQMGLKGGRSGSTGRLAGVRRGRVRPRGGDLWASGVWKYCTMLTISNSNPINACGPGLRPSFVVQRCRVFWPLPITRRCYRCCRRRVYLYLKNVCIKIVIRKDMCRFIPGLAQNTRRCKSSQADAAPGSDKGGPLSLLSTHRRGFRLMTTGTVVPKNLHWSAESLPPPPASPVSTFLVYTIIQCVRLNSRLEAEKPLIGLHLKPTPEEESRNELL